MFVSAALAASPKTVWDGVYTDAQATRGQAAYMTECSRCHGEDHRASGNVIVGAKFMQQWREDNLNNLYTILRNTMPRNAPRSLPEGTYLDIVSYMLKLNGFPAGKADLAIADVADIMLVGKEGPSAVPDFALVTITGCLGPITGDTSFVSAATEPVRTRQPQKSQGDEMATAFAKAAGTRKLALMGVAYNAAGAEPSHRVEAKGFLIRLPEGDKLNVTSLQTNKTACTP
ncbi:MAG: cytochrome c [Bryobacterales bacterium]|nr:cytochrome c [Bryobacterales bacterium]